MLHSNWCQWIAWKITETNQNPDNIPTKKSQAKSQTRVLDIFTYIYTISYYFIKSLTVWQIRLNGLNTRIHVWKRNWFYRTKHPPVLSLGCNTCILNICDGVIPSLLGCFLKSHFALADISGFRQTCTSGAANCIFIIQHSKNVVAIINILQDKFAPLVLKSEYSGKLGQCHGCRYPCSLRCLDISIHGRYWLHTLNKSLPRRRRSIHDCLCYIIIYLLFPSIDYALR